MELEFVTGEVGTPMTVLIKHGTGVLGLLLFAFLLISTAVPAAATTDFLDQEEWEHEVRRHGVDPGRIPNPLAVTDEMRAMALQVAGRGSTRQKLDRLHFFLYDEDKFKFSYDAGTTLTAREAFEDRTGNCVSFTNLFITLARSIDLQVQPALVFHKGKLEQDGDLIIVNNHIVAAYKGTSGTLLYDFYRFRTEAVVGFAPIDDLWNTGVYLNNLGTRALRNGQLELALELIETSVSLAPRFTAAYGNLGVIRRRMGDHDGSFEAYILALQINRHDATIRGNLSKLIQLETESDIMAQGWEPETIPSKLRGLVTRGDMKLAGRNMKAAKSLYRDAMKLDTSSPLPVLAMARLHMIRGNLLASSRAVNRALSLDPDSTDAARLRLILDKL